MGYNIAGRLGDGTQIDRITPVQIESNGVSSIATGNEHSLYLKSDGSLWATGEIILASWETERNLRAIASADRKWRSHKYYSRL